MMDDFPPAPISELQLNPQRWQNVLDAAQRFCQQGTLPALSFELQQRGLTTGVQCFGSRSLSQQEPVTPETRFLVASLTKPMVAMAVLLLVQRGDLSLNQRVVEVLPEFRDGPKRPITVRHLLTHTSGLPDMLPNNEELRQAQSPLAAFVSGACAAELAFQPGRTAQYQSMGYALLGPIIERVSGQPYQDFIRNEMFVPLGMHDSHLGIPESTQHTAPIAEVRVPEPQQGGVTWNWNSSYWRGLGAPWGGAICTVSDVSRFCRAMLTGGVLASGERLFSPATIREATTNRLDDFPLLPEAEVRTRGWGLGWRLNWKDHRATFSDLLPAEAIGHWGATGCLCWIDRDREAAAVLLSTQPTDKDISPLLRLSNMLAAALDG